MGNKGAVAFGFEKAPQTLQESMDGLTKLVSAHLSSRLKNEVSHRGISCSDKSFALVRRSHTRENIGEIPQL